MGVQIRHEFIYPLEDAFVLYLPDYFNNSLFVIQGEHPLSDYSVSYISIIVEISRLISIIVEINLLLSESRCNVIQLFVFGFKQVGDFHA